MKKIILGNLIAVFLTLSATLLFAQDPPESPLYSFSVETIDGDIKNLKDYKGKAVLVVNTASQCGYTPQYESLEKLYQTYKDRGLEIFAFPANNFKNQEPGDNKQIKEFCALKYKTTFPLFAKISVLGDDIHPLYTYLTTQSGEFNGEITWNFNKFLISPDGQVTARFTSRIDPLDASVIARLEEVLPQKAGESNAGQ